MDLYASFSALSGISVRNSICRASNSMQAVRLYSILCRQASMNDIQSRLLRCFAAAFPEVSEENLPGLTPESTEQWDSEAMAILLALIQEEFGFEIDVPEQLAHLVSCPLIY